MMSGIQVKRQRAAWAQLARAEYEKRMVQHEISEQQRLDAILYQIGELDEPVDPLDVLFSARGYPDLRQDKR